MGESPTAPLTRPHPIGYRDGVPEDATPLEARITRLWLHLVCDHSDEAGYLAVNGTVGGTQGDLDGLVELHHELHSKHDRYIDVVAAARHVLGVFAPTKFSIPDEVKNEALGQLQAAVARFDDRRDDQEDD